MIDSMNAAVGKVVEDDHDGLTNGASNQKKSEFGMKKLIQLVNDFVTEMEAPKIPQEMMAESGLTNKGNVLLGGGGGATK